MDLFSSFGTIVGAIVVLASSSVSAGFISALFQRRKTAADASKAGADAVAVLGQTAAALVLPLHDQLQRLSDDLSQANGQIDVLRHSLREATVKIEELEYQVEIVTNRLNQANKSLQDQGLDPF